MVAPGAGSLTAIVLCPSPTQRLLSQGSETSNGKTLGKQYLFKQDVKRATGKVIHSESKKHVFTHSLYCVQHFSCDSPVRFMMYSEATAAFISLHSDNTVCLYNADGRKQTSSVDLLFMGLTTTKISGCVVGWGPGPIFTLLDRDLRPVDAAHDALDIRVCQPAEHSSELVTAGVGNVCVWSVRLMRCKVKIQEGLHSSTFSHMALAPPRSDRPHRAFVVCGQVLTVVDLDVGKVLEHKRDLCSRDITAIVYCSQLDCLIIASEERSIRVWGPDWELRVAFVGHNGVVNSLFYCSELHMLLSASVDCTIRCWNVEEGDVIDCVHTEQKTPLLCIGGTRKGDTFFSFSHQGVDFWTIRNLYNLHCKLKKDEGAPLRQILVSPFPAPYPRRVLCVSGDSDVALVAAETGAVLTSFKAYQRLLCADYCLHKEILLALTEAGTVIQANTLTNPITLMQEWKGRGQGPWQQRDHVTRNDAQNLPIPGPPCCLVLYSYVAEIQTALEEWRSLQDRRGCSHRNKAALHDAKNRFLIILGQNGGCVSVLTLDNGKVLYRAPAHSGQKVTTVQVYPENGCLLSTGEDLTVVVWKVSPYIQECLSQQLSLHCGQPHVYLAALGPQLALTFQDPNSGIYSLMHFNLFNQSPAGQPPRDGHLDHFTGLCVCPDLDVFVSSSLDGTVHIWNEENHLIGTLQLNTVPECLAYGGFGGELFLGIRGDLYRMNCAQFLPYKYQQMLLYAYCAEPLPDMPIIENKEMTSDTAVNKEEESEMETDATDQLLTEAMWRQKEYESLLISNMDLSALLQGTVKCKKVKPLSTKQTKKEAFDHYMKILYGLPPNIKIDLEDSFEPDTFSFCPKPSNKKPCKTPPPPPPLKEDVRPEPKLITPVIVKKKKRQEEKAPVPSSKPKTVKKVKTRPVERVIPKKPIVVEEDEAPPEIIPPIEEPKPKPAPPPPPPRPRTPTPCPPSPEVPTFLKQFADADWFRDLFPDKKSIPSTLSPEEFSLQLLGHLNSTASKMKILAALQTLRSQGLLQNTDKLYQGLIDLVPKFVRPKMSPLERSVLVEMLNLLMRLKSASYDLVKKLLTLLAFKKLGLREPVLRMLTILGVDEAEQWLQPELESWESELQDQRNIWKNLHDRADSWLELWISKYKDHKRYLYLGSTESWNPPSCSVVDVLNYFCFVQKEEYRKARCVAPSGRKNTVLLPLYDCSSQPIIRLGETYSMARIRRPPGIILPPLRNRPFLMRFPNFISLPLSRVTLCPFRTYSDEDWLKTSTRRYFIQQQSYVEYYR
ncbi:WD repeat-containing protein 97 isoform X3 [Trachinotus anak]|uniref:WD repeat-containing protein 97 isoform X3 n=1 Tax=Trachinotus anak TaxID=443729 RepID=UPI0039F241E6